jgi:osmotically-inducible protein OsmY
MLATTPKRGQQNMNKGVLGGARKLRWLVVGGVLLGGGCNRQDTERLARVGHQVAGKAETLMAGTNNRLARCWQAMTGDLDGMAAEARIATRLRWDKSLEKADIQVMMDNGRIVLRGTVADRSQRQKALELAESTVGAGQVADEIQVTGPEP